MPSIDLTGYRLTFDDEFNSRSISQTGAGTTWADIRPEWRYDKNSDIGFGHSSFVDPSSGYDPFQVGGGALTITAVPDRTPSGYPGSWESGLIHTKSSFAQTYGYYEIRADFSGQKGAWDAFWLMPVTKIPDPYKAGNWQELDVVEHYGGWDKGVYSTIHTTDPQNGVPWQQNRQVYSELPSPAGYHTYGMNWQSDRISFYVDGKLVGSQATPSDMHGPMYLIANLATQGPANATNNADAAGVPISSSIDYIRVYSNAPGAVAVAQQTVSSPDGQDPGLYGATAAVAQVAVSSPATALGASLGGSVDAKVFALYEGLLGRAPDAAGAQGWAFALTHGAGTADIAQGLLASAEGQGRINPAVSNAAFVGQLYQAVLDRPADAAGAQGWTAQLDGGASRATVANALVFSAEHLGQLKQDGASAAYLAGTTDAAVARLYLGLLNRAPDAVGFQGWQKAAHDGTPLSTIAQAFLNSPEYQAAHPSAGNDLFVASVYGAGLGRAPDAVGQQTWASTLAQGTSQADVAVAILGSPEAQQHLASQAIYGFLIT